ncbi:hypothetical protein [Olsenella massiliensis]|uniref:hypothetical protein n=1 Tax=Olsenella massiliensis TaxID=1622075 RepID=UPI00071E16A7|nr:hypothetical protein [Olsenella massiliensis]
MARRQVFWHEAEGDEVREAALIEGDGLVVIEECSSGRLTEGVFGALSYRRSVTLADDEVRLRACRAPRRGSAPSALIRLLAWFYATCAGRLVDIEDILDEAGVEYAYTACPV